MNTMINIQGLSKEFDQVTAVNNISFSVREGDLFAFLGTNGAGKSTTISIICTLLTKTSGVITVNGFDMERNPSAIRSCLGVVFQSNVLDDLLTVKDNLTIRGRFQGLYGDNLKVRLDELKRLFDLTEIWKRPYGKLSGGQKRKCEIARAIIGTPKLLILDEPTTGLDPQTRKSIWKLIRDLQTTQGMTVFLTTHYMEEAAAADSIVILDKGTICAKGTPDMLKSKYSKDTLKIWLNDTEDGCEKLKNMGYVPQVKSDFLILPVDNSHDAMRILREIGDFLDFELVKGNLDDVFLTVTDYKEVPQP